MPVAHPVQLITQVRFRAVAGAIALTLGLALFYTAGFAAPGVLHNATHDTRHALGLPCH